MRTALVHDWLNGMRGGEKVLEELCLMFPEADLYTLFHEPDRMSATINAMNVITSPLQRLPFTRSHYRHLLPLLPWAIGRFDLSGYDLVISSSHCVARGARAPAAVPHVCYCHSPMRSICRSMETPL